MVKKKTTKKKASKTIDASIEPVAHVAVAPAEAPSPKEVEKKRTKKPRAAVASAADDGATDPPTDAEMALLRNYPMLSAAVVAHFYRVERKFEVIAKQTLAAWQSMGDGLTLPGLSMDVLAQALATFDVVAPIEQKILPYYERARVTRLKAQSDAAGVLFALARAVKAAGGKALTQRFSPLIDWIAATHTPKKPRAKKAAAKDAQK